MPQPTPTPTPTPAATPQIANPPSGITLAQAPGSALTVTWSVPVVDSTHDAASGFNLQFSPSGAGTWTIVSGVSSPYLLSGPTPGEAVDVQLQSVNAGGISAWSATSTLSTVTAVPNVPGSVSLALGTGSDLMVSWTPPVIDSTHGAAAGFNLRYSPSGAGTWTIMSGVTSPYDLSGLAGGAAIDVELQGSNAGGVGAWSATSTLTTSAAGPLAPNAPAITGVAPPPDGTATKLTVSWTPSAIDNAHGAATGYNLRFSPAGTGAWTTMSGVTSPVTLTGLTGATAIDVEIQGTNAAASPGGWSATVTGTTWGATIVPGNWTAAASQVHGTPVAPNQGVQMDAAAAPTAVTGAAFAWSSGQSTIPTTGLIAASIDGQANGWGAYFSAPATTGTFYLWMLAQGAGGVTTGALVSSAITVS